MLSDLRVVCPVLVGRAPVLDAVHALLVRAHSGNGSVALVAGEPGIGKSSVLRAVAGDAERLGFLRLRGSCFEADRGVPYAPLLDLVQELTATASRPATARLLAPAAAELVHTFPELASTFPGAATLEPLGADQERRRLLQATATALAELAKAQPVLLTIEDMQWGDEATLQLIHHLARRVTNQRVVIALSYRSDEVGAPLAQLLADLDRSRVSTEVRLGRLTDGDLREMLGAIFENAPPGGDFGRTLAALTEGNPFFIEEVIKGLLSTGDLTQRTDGSWHARSLERIQPPRTAVEAVRRRLSGLTVEGRRIASLAAVAGRRFDFQLLQWLTGMDEAQLLAVMRELVAAQLVSEESPDRFVFRHALTREALTSDLLTRERVALHAAIADAIERSGEAAEAHVESLAYHRFAAMDWARAELASSRAAERALALHAPREALTHVDRAMHAAREAGHAASSTLCLLRGRALETLGDFTGACDEFTTALAAAERTGDDHPAWAAHHALGMLWAARDYARAGAHRHAARDLARRIGDAALIARSLNRVANWHVNLDQPAPAQRDHEEALALFEHAGDAHGVAETVDLLAMTHFVAGDMVTATGTYERAIALHERLNDRRALAASLALLCLCNGSCHASSTTFGASALTRQLLAGDRPVQLARDIGWRAGEAFAHFILGDCLVWRGRYQRGLPMLRESLAIAEEMQHLQWSCGALRALGCALMDLECTVPARDALERAYEISRQLGSHLWIRWCAAPLALARARRGDLDSAMAVLDAAGTPPLIGREALREGDEGQPTLGERHLAVARAEVSLLASEGARALALVDARLDAEHAAGAARVPRLTYLRARALVALGSLDEAEHALAMALEEATACDALPLVWRVHATHGAVLQRQKRRAEARAAYALAREVAGALAVQVDNAEWREVFERHVAEAAPELRPTPRQRTKAAFGGLTRRERDVSRLVAHGKSNRLIARALGIGERTVEGHVASALGRLGFTSRSQLAVWAAENGLLAHDSRGST